MGVKGYRISKRDPSTTNSVKFSKSPSREGLTVACDGSLRVYIANQDQVKMAGIIYNERFQVYLVAEQVEGTECMFYVLKELEYRIIYNNTRQEVPQLLTSSYTSQRILNLECAVDYLVAVMSTSVQIYKIKLVSLLDDPPGESQDMLQEVFPPYATYQNAFGLCQISGEKAKKRIVCFPAMQEGHVQIMSLEGLRQSSRPSSQLTLPAHEGPLSCLRLSNDGTLLATASDKGTLIRVFCTTAHMKLHEFRRGVEACMIYDIDISSSNDTLACYSRNCSVHIWSLSTPSLNNKAMIGKQVKAAVIIKLTEVAEDLKNVRCRVALMPGRRVKVASYDSRLFDYTYDLHQGSAHLRGASVYADVVTPFMESSWTPDDYQVFRPETDRDRPSAHVQTSHRRRRPEMGCNSGKVEDGIKRWAEMDKKSKERTEDPCEPFTRLGAELTRDY